MPIFTLLFMGVMTIQAAENTSNWPQFRGADSTGVSANEGLPDRWSATENVEWKSELPGRGWGSPVVWGNRIFLSTVVNSGETEPLKKGLYFGGDRPQPSSTIHEWKVLCLELETGNLVWERTVKKGAPTTSIHLKNSYASETPITDGERVYVCFGNVGIFCFDFEGQEVWNYLLPSRPTRFGWGTAASPVLHGNSLYYVSDNDEKSSLSSLDKQSGSLLWSIDREEKSNWATPFVWVHGDTTEIVTAGTGAVRSYDQQGKLIWSLKGMSSITIATPYVADGLLYISSGYVLDPVKALYAIKSGASGDLTLAKGETSNPFIAWSSQKIAPYNPTTLVDQGRLFILYDRGTVGCYEAQTGATLYEGQRLQRGSAFTASPWSYGKKIFCLDEDGVCSVIAAGDKFEVLHTNSLADDEICLSTPAIAGDRLLIRTDKRLYSLRLEKK